MVSSMETMALVLEKKKRFYLIFLNYDNSSFDVGL